MNDTTTPGRTAAEEIVLTVGAPAHGGHCVARPADDPSGRVVFVRHTLPGETVRAVLTEKNSKIWRADAVDVLSASPDRVRQVWPEAGPGGVGGGELGHVALPSQRIWKRWVLADCLRRIGGQEVADAVARLPEAAGAGAPPVDAMPSEVCAEADADPRVSRRASTGTRTRVGLTVGDDGRAGMHAFRSGRVLPVRSLPLAVPEIRDLGLTERAVWRKRYRPGTRIDAVAPGGGEPVVVLTQERGGSRVLTGGARTTGRRRVDEIVDASTLGLGKLHYSVHADGFWQVHRDAPSVLVDRVVRAALSGTPTAGPLSGEGPARIDEAQGVRVVELYSGAGLFTLPLTLFTGRVRSLEVDERAVGDARRNLHRHDGAHLAVGRVTAASVARAAFDGLSSGADVVVLDPPRQGLGRGVGRAVAALGAERIVLVACDPAALARDLGTLLGEGYELAAMSALDMFPHTHHFETVAVLVRGR